MTSDVELRFGEWVKYGGDDSIFAFNLICDTFMLQPIGDKKTCVSVHQVHKQRVKHTNQKGYCCSESDRVIDSVIVTAKEIEICRSGIEKLVWTLAPGKIFSSELLDTLAHIMAKLVSIVTETIKYINMYELVKDGTNVYEIASWVWTPKSIWELDVESEPAWVIDVMPLKSGLGKWFNKVAGSFITESEMLSDDELVDIEEFSMAMTVNSDLHWIVTATMIKSSVKETSTEKDADRISRELGTGKMEGVFEVDEIDKVKFVKDGELKWQKDCTECG